METGRLVKEEGGGRRRREGDCKAMSPVPMLLAQGALIRFSVERRVRCAVSRLPLEGWWGWGLGDQQGDWAVTW